MSECPGRLVPTKDVSADATVLEVGPCSVPCPSIVWTDSEWSMILNIIRVFCALSLVTSFVSYIAHSNSNRFLVKMFMLGFCVSSFTLLVFLLIDVDNTITCEGESAFVKRHPVCVIQSVVLMYSFLWTECWAFCQAVHLYFIVVLRMRKEDLDRLERIYLVCCILVPLILVLIPLAEQNVGFDPKANIPLCFFLFSSDSTYFWFVFFVPLCALVGFCAILMCFSGYKIHKVLSATALSSHSPQSPIDRRTDYLSSNSQQDERSTETEERTNPVHTYGQTGYNPYSANLQTSVSSELSTGSSAFSSNPSNPNSLHFLRSGQAEDPSAFSRHEPDDFEPGSSTFSRHHPNALSAPYGTQRGTMNNHNYYGGPSGSESDPSMLQSSYAGESSFSHLSRVSPLSRFIHWATRGRFGESEDLSLSTASMSSRRNQESIWKNLFKYNKRPIMFIMAFCISTIVTIPCCIYIYAIKYKDYDDSATDYSTCLYYSQFATYNPQGLSATELCGEHPSQRPPMFPFLFIMIYTAAYGIIPFVIFGFGTSPPSFLVPCKNALDTFNRYVLCCEWLSLFDGRDSFERDSSQLADAHLDRMNLQRGEDSKKGLLKHSHNEGLTNVQSLNHPSDWDEEKEGAYSSFSQYSHDTHMMEGRGEEDDLNDELNDEGSQGSEMARLSRGTANHNTWFLDGDEEEDGLESSVRENTMGSETGSVLSEQGGRSSRKKRKSKKPDPAVQHQEDVQCNVREHLQDVRLSEHSRGSTGDMQEDEEEHT